MTYNSFTVDIKIGMLGLRNLMRSAYKPHMSFQLTNNFSKDGNNDKQEISLVEVNTVNPNFGDIIVFKEVELPCDPLLWPQLEIEIWDEGYMMGLMGGCEYCYTTISLFEFAPLTIL
jgi:hypothetical protein